MVYEEILGQASTIEEATQKAIVEASSLYGVDEEDLDIAIMQEPSNRIFSKRDAIVSVKVNQRKLEEIRKMAKEEEERERARHMAELQAQAERKRLEYEELLVQIKETRLDIFKYDVTLPRFICDNLIIFYAVFDQSPFMKKIEIKDLVEEWIGFEGLYRSKGYLSLAVLSAEENKIRERIKDLFDMSQIDDLHMFNLNLDGQMDIIIRPQRFIDGEFVQWGDSFDECERILKQEYNLRSSYEIVFGEGAPYTAYMNFIRIYFEFLIQLVNLNFFFECRDKAMENQEFSTIVFNEIGDFVKKESVEKLYRIYRQYYLNIFSQELCPDEFEVVLVCMSHLQDKRNDFGSVKAFLSDKGINLEELMDEIMERREGRTVYRCLEDIIEDGRFDAFTNCPDSAIPFIFDGINYQMLILWPVELWSEMIFECNEVMDHMKNYFEKYLLLHPEIASQNKKTDIKRDYQNAVTGVDFEKVLKKLFEAYGYLVNETKTTGDQGADLIIEKEKKRTVIQAKYYSSNVGNSAVQEVVAAMAFYNADSGMVVTNSRFTNSAMSLAQANSIVLIDGEKLQEMINKLG